LVARGTPTGGGASVVPVSGQRYAKRVRAPNFKLDAGGLLVEGLHHEREFQDDLIAWGAALKTLRKTSASQIDEGKLSIKNSPESETLRAFFLLRL
jgi:hypothetical protein